jgi:hypothetical protein
MNNGLNMKDDTPLHFNIQYFSVFFSMNMTECWMFGYTYSYKTELYFW